MKIRSDFVTNSSSSSFIVGFESKENVSADLEKEKILDCYRRDRLVKAILSGEIKDLDAYLAEYREDIYYSVKWRIEDDIEKMKGWQNARTWIEKNEDEFESMVQRDIDKSVAELKSKLTSSNFISVIEVADHDDSELEHEIMPHLSCTIKRISHH